MNGGDGSAEIEWYLQETEASFVQENQYEGWAEDCTGRAETYIGSNIYNQAWMNSDILQRDHPQWRDGIFNDGEGDEED